MIGMRPSPLVYFLSAIVIVLGNFLGAKSNVWVYTDMSDPRDQRPGGHPFNDPDDIVTMAALLLEANRINIETIVVSSTNRQYLGDSMDFVNNVLLEAYHHDVPYLNEALGGFPETINFVRSSNTQVAIPKRFDPKKDYSQLDGHETVASLIEYAQTNEVYVLCWGPLTEPAIAVKHCMDTDNWQALKNMTFIAHWTMSFIAQGTPETPYKVANCNDDSRACRFIHDQAKLHPEIKYIELGSVGQKGIVDGSGGFRRLDEFNHSRLGQIYLHAKRYGDKPDMSDGSTFWLLSEAFGVTLEDYPHDGTLTQEIEEANRDAFKANGHRIVGDLLERSNIAAQAKNPFPESLIAGYFTYVFQFLDGRYYIHAPYDFSYQFFDSNHQVVRKDDLKAGKYQLDLSDLKKGPYKVQVRGGGITQYFDLERR